MIRKLFTSRNLNRYLFSDNKVPPNNKGIQQGKGQTDGNKQEKQPQSQTQKQQTVKKSPEQSQQSEKVQQPKQAAKQTLKDDPVKAEPIKQTEKPQQPQQPQSPIQPIKSSPVLKEELNIEAVQQKGKIEQHSHMSLNKDAYMDYKSYPTHLPHNDPHSDKYIESERDEYKQNVLIDEYNAIVKQLKNDLHMQKQVYDVLEKMDRPYLQGQPGNTKNISIGLQNYGKVEDLGFPQTSDEYENEYLEKVLKNQDRWISNTTFYPKYNKMSHEVEHEKELENRPVNDHFHPDKGSKYDVVTPYEQRFPFLADRLGHPEILGTPFERLLRLEGDIFHPVNLDQPFVQIPSPEPNKDLSFEEGEVIYENVQLIEWVKFFKLTGLSVYAFFALFVPYNLILKTHMCLQDGYNNIFMPYYQHSYFNFDNLNMHIPAAAGIGMYMTYFLFAGSDKVFRDYVVKLQYSKDKELLFVTRVSPYGSTEEEVYEMAHLEVLPPSVKTSLPFLSSNQSDGLWDITCMNTQTNLVVNNEDKYWAPGHKKEFINKVTGLWQDFANGAKYDTQVELQK